MPSGNNLPQATHRVRSQVAQDGAVFRALLWSLIALALAIGFAVLGSEMAEGDTKAFDQYLLGAATALRAAHPWLSGVMRDLSGLGSTTVLTLTTVAAVGYLALLGTRSTALMVALSASTGSALVSVLKWGYGRLRPDPASADFVATGLSFPSGHATSSAVVYLTLGVLFASTRVRLAERAYIVGVCAVVTALVGLSRVLLGVHWATDVLGGWAIGAAWAMVWLLVSRMTTEKKSA